MLPNHSPRINAHAKTAPLPPSNTCRSLLCCRDLACDCGTNQCLVPHVSSMEILQTQPVPLPTATWEFLLQSAFTNGIHSLRVSKGFGKTRPNFALYLLEKLCLTGEAAAAPKGGTQEQLSPQHDRERWRPDPGPGLPAQKGQQHLWHLPKNQIWITEQLSYNRWRKFAAILVGCR